MTMIPITCDRISQVSIRLNASMCHMHWTFNVCSPSNRINLVVFVFFSDIDNGQHIHSLTQTNNWINAQAYVSLRWSLLKWNFSLKIISTLFFSLSHSLLMVLLLYILIWEMAKNISLLLQAIPTATVPKTNKLAPKLFFLLFLCVRLSLFACLFWMCSVWIVAVL